MCGCDNNINVVDLPHIKIYTSMAEYKIKESFIGGKTIFSGGRVVSWAGDMAQEELAYLFEDVNGGATFIEKIGKSTKKSNEESSIKESKKSDSKKKDISKKDDKEE